MTPSEFAAKWSAATGRMLGYQTPTDADPAGEWYAFEKGAEKTAGGDGFADVWKRGHFGWEYKGKKKDLGAAYKQLLDYREALENPPLLVVCDMDRFEVHTNFTNTVKQVHAFTLADLSADPKEPLRVLRAVMGNPDALRPSQTRARSPERLRSSTTPSQSASASEAMIRWKPRTSSTRCSSRCSLRMRGCCQRASCGA